MIFYDIEAIVMETGLVNFRLNLMEINCDLEQCHLYLWVILMP